MRATSRDALFCGFPSFLQSVHEHPCIWPYMSALSFVFQVSHFGCAEAYTHHLLFRAPWMRLYMQHVQHVNTHIKNTSTSFSPSRSMHKKPARKHTQYCRRHLRLWFALYWQNLDQQAPCTCVLEFKKVAGREGANKEKVGGGEETSVQAPEALICRGRI